MGIFSGQAYKCGTRAKNREKEFGGGGGEGS